MAVVPIELPVAVQAERVASASALLVDALWSLQEAGAIALERFDEKRFKLFSTSGIRVRLLAAPRADGLEGAIAGALERVAGRRGAVLSALVWALCASSRSDAESLVRSGAGRHDAALVERSTASREAARELHDELEATVSDTLEAIELDRRDAFRKF